MVKNRKNNRRVKSMMARIQTATHELCAYLTDDLITEMGKYKADDRLSS